MWYARTGILIAAMLCTGAVGCHRQQMAARSASAPAARGSTVRLVVDNDNTSSFDVFLISNDGWRTRMGTVDPLGTARYTVPPDLLAGGTVRVLATSLGGFGAARSDRLMVAGGDTITFIIEPDLRASYATVR